MRNNSSFKIMVAKKIGEDCIFLPFKSLAKIESDKFPMSTFVYKKDDWVIDRTFYSDKDDIVTFIDNENGDGVEIKDV